MSVAAASGAASTQPHQQQQPTQEQIRLAQLIDDKKHDQPEVQEIVRKVLDVVANSNQDDALLALFDCDYDYEKAVALLIEKGHEVASEWRTATNHKVTKKQQQQQNKAGTTKNGHGGVGESDENGHQQQQQQQRGGDGSIPRGKSRGGRSRFQQQQQQQQNGGDSQSNVQQHNENYVPQRQRGGSGYRGSYRGNYRAGHRGTGRNYHHQQQQQQQQHEQQPQDSNVDTSLSSDTPQRLMDVPYQNRRGAGGGTGRHHQSQAPQLWDVGNWNGETQVYSRTNKDDEQPSNSDNPNVQRVQSTMSHAPPGVTNGQTSLGVSATGVAPSQSEFSGQQQQQQQQQQDFDPVEAARQIKNVIGIGQQQQQKVHSAPPKPLMDLKPLMGEQTGQKQGNIPSKTAVITPTSKMTPPPPRIPHQPVIFSDHFDGGIDKIDVQFGSLGEPFDEGPPQPPTAPPVSNSSAFYHPSESSTAQLAAMAKQNSASSPAQSSQRTTHHQTVEQSSYVSPASRSTAHMNNRPSEQHLQQTQLPVINQQRMLPHQMQQQQQQQHQPPMTMKPVVPPQYAVHQQQHQMNASNMILQSLLFQQQQQEPVALDTSYDPTAFPLQSIDFSTPYFMAAMNQQQPPPQQQTQPRYIVSQQPLQPPPQQQQPTSNRQQQSSTNLQQTSVPASSSSSVPTPPVSSSSSSNSTAKKAPAVPPGMFISTAPPPQVQPGYSTAYSTTYGVPQSVGGQQQTGATTYSPAYDAEHIFTNAFMQIASVQQAQSPSGTYGSVTPPVQQQQNQQQQQLNNNDKQTMNFHGPINENLLRLQQFAIQQSNSQQQGQQAATHSPATLSYFLGHPASGPSYSPGPQIMYAPPATAMAQQQQQPPKQQAQQYNQNNSASGIGANDDYYGRASSSSNKEPQYMYTVPTPQQQVPPQSAGQQQGVNKQHQQQQQRGNVYNNQPTQPRSFQ